MEPATTSMPADRRSDRPDDRRGHRPGDRPDDRPDDRGDDRGDDNRPLRSAVVVNPARVQDLDERRRAVDGVLAEAGWPAPEWIETTPEDGGTGQARRAVADGAEVVFACGGDGTVRAVIEGVAGSDAALAVLPAGTGNLLATNLGLPEDPAEGARLAVGRGRRRIDVGEVDGRTFAVMAGMGFDADMLGSANTTLKARIGPLAYVLSAAKHLRDRGMHVEVEVDADPPRRRTARTVIVGNVGRLQGGVPLLPDAEPDNGAMDVAIISPRTLGHWVSLTWSVLRRHERVPRMEVLRGRRVVVTCDRPQPRQLDGDVVEPGRSLAVTVRPAALWLCVYRPDDSADLTEGSPAAP